MTSLTDLLPFLLLGWALLSIVAAFVLGAWLSRHHLEVAG